MKLTKVTPFRYKKSPFRQGYDSSALGNLRSQFNQAMEGFEDLPTGTIDVGEGPKIGGLDTRNLNKDFENKYRDITNPYANLSTQNLAEDLTVNKQQFDAQRQMQEQGGADALAAMRAGGGFNAGNIQALQNQMQRGAQNISGQIGIQEQANQQARVRGAQDVQRRQELQASGQLQTEQLQAQGASEARQLKSQQELNVLGMQSQRDISRAQLQAQHQQLQYQSANDARTLQYQKQQGLLSLISGQMTAQQEADLADQNWAERNFG